MPPIPAVEEKGSSRWEDVKLPYTVICHQLVLLLIVTAFFLVAGCARQSQDSISSSTPIKQSAQTAVRARTTVPETPELGSPTLTVAPLLGPALAVTPEPTQLVPEGLTSAVPLETPQPTQVAQLPEVRRSEPTLQSVPTSAESTTSVEVRAFAVQSARFGHSATLMDDGRVLVSGGFTGVANNNKIDPIPINTFQIYDPATDSWLLLFRDVIPSFGSGAIRLSEGKYLSMGITAFGSEPTGSAGILDTQNMSWTILPSPPSARGFPALALLQDGRVLVLSGLVPSGSHGSVPESIRDTVTLDPSTGIWEAAAPVSNAGGSPTVVSLDDGRIMVLQDWVSGAEIYDPASDVWTLASPPNGTFPNVTAVKLPGGTVLVTGGASEADGANGAAPAAETYDPSADTWTFTGPMKEKRIHHTLTLMPDGNVIAIGGVDANLVEPLATSEIYDPRTNKWLPGPEISVGRYTHSATLLSDGRILIFGGIRLDGDEMQMEPTHSYELLEMAQSGQ